MKGTDKTTVYLDPDDYRRLKGSPQAGRPRRGIGAGGRGGIRRPPRASADAEERWRVLERPPRSQRTRRRPARRHGPRHREGHERGRGHRNAHRPAPGPQAMIVADTGAIVALIDKSDRHHRTLVRALSRGFRPVGAAVGHPAGSGLPGRSGNLGPRAEEAFLADLADGAFQVEWGRDADMRAPTHCPLSAWHAASVVRRLAGTGRLRPIVSAHEAKPGRREMRIERKRQADAALLHEYETDRIDCRKLVKVGPIEISLHACSRSLAVHRRILK